MQPVRPRLHGSAVQVGNPSGVTHNGLGLVVVGDGGVGQEHAAMAEAVAVLRCGGSHQGEHR